MGTVNYVFLQNSFGKTQILAVFFHGPYDTAHIIWPVLKQYVKEEEQNQNTDQNIYPAIDKPPGYDSISQPVSTQPQPSAPVEVPIQAAFAPGQEPIQTQPSASTNLLPQSSGRSFNSCIVFWSFLFRKIWAWSFRLLWRYRFLLFLMVLSMHCCKSNCNKNWSQWMLLLSWCLVFWRMCCCLS